MLNRLILNTIAPHECIECGMEGELLCKQHRNDVEVAESRCSFCNKPTTEHNLCSACVNEKGFEKILVATNYNGSTKELIRLLKFNNNKAAAGMLAKIIVDKIGVYFDEGQVISYVPTATGRVRQRGYDQSKLIAKEVARLTSLEFSPTLLRVDQARSTGYSRSERPKAQAYKPISRNSIRGISSLILIDDVITTGNTMAQARSQRVILYGVRQNLLITHSHPLGMSVWVWLLLFQLY